MGEYSKGSEAVNSAPGPRRGGVRAGYYATPSAHAHVQWPKKTDARPVQADKTDVGKIVADTKAGPEGALRLA